MKYLYQTAIQNELFNILFFTFLILIFIYLTKLIKTSSKPNFEKSRKFVHLSVGILCSISPYYFKTPLFPLIISVIFLSIIIFSFFNKKFLEKIHTKDRVSYGLIYFPIGYIIQIICFWGYKEYFALSFLILAICDPIASIIGNKKNNYKHFTLWEDSKTLIGTSAFFLSCFTLSFLYSYIFFNIPFYKAIFFSLFISFGSTLAEIMSNKGSDNISIPFFSILFMFAFDNHNTVILNIPNLIIVNHATLFIIVSILFSLAYYLNFLSLSGYYSGFLMATIITFLGGLKFLIPLALFFILSSLLSVLSIEKNLSIKPKRNIIQVYANGGIGLLICCFNYFNPTDMNYYLFLCSISAAISDTWATEIGKFSKSDPVSIINFKKVNKGYSGGITFLGLLGSILGPTLLTFSCWLSYHFSLKLFLLIIIIGFLGSILDSIIGATLQVKYKNELGELVEVKEKGSEIISGFELIDNNMVNFINTLISPILFYLITIMGMHT